MGDREERRVSISSIYTRHTHYIDSVPTMKRTEERESQSTQLSTVATSTEASSAETTLSNNEGGDEPQGADGEEPSPKAYRSWWRRGLRWLGIGIATVFAILILGTALLYLPVVQGWLLGLVRTEIAERAGIALEWERVGVAFPLKLRLEEVRATEIASGDELGSVGLLTADVRLLPLLRGGRLPIGGVVLERGRARFSLSNDSIQVAGAIGRLALDHIDLDLSMERIEAGNLGLYDTDLYLTIITAGDSVKEPEKDPSHLLVELSRGELRNVAAYITLLSPPTISDTLPTPFPLPLDSLTPMRINSYITRGDLRGVQVDLGSGRYGAATVDLAAGLTALGDSSAFAQPSPLPLPWYAELKGHEVWYGGVEELRGELEHLHYAVGDGVVLQEGRISLRKEGERLVAKGLELSVGETHLKGSASLPFRGWLPDSVGVADLRLEGVLSPKDVGRFVGERLARVSKPLEVALEANGTMEDQLTYALRMKGEEVAELSLKGVAKQPLAEGRKVDATLELQTGRDLREWLLTLMEGKEGKKVPSWDIPEGVQIRGSARYSAEEMGADLQLRQATNMGGGDLTLHAFYHPRREEYYADLRVRDLALQPFLPYDTIGPLSATINLEGRGTDPFDQRSRGILYVDVDSVSYRGYRLQQMTLLSQLKDHQLFAALNTDSEGLRLAAQSDIMMRRDSLSGSINILVDTVVPSAIGVDLPILQAGKLELRSNVMSDLKQRYQWEGEIENFVLVTDKGTIYPKNTYLTLHTSERDLGAEVASGDLSLHFAAKNGLNDFTTRLQKVMEEAEKSLADSVGQVNMAPWIHYYPDMELRFEMGRDNLLRAYLDEHRIGATSVSLDLQTVAGEGLSGLGVVSHFQSDTFRIDNIDLVLRQDSAFFTAMGTVHKEPFLNQPAFDMILSLSSNVHRSEAYINWLDSKQEPFVQMGLELMNRPNGDLTLGFTPDPVVLAYNRFEVVGEDFVTLPKEDRNKILAQLELATAEGTWIKIHNLPDERGHLLRATISDLRLADLGAVPWVPDLSGRLNATVDWLQLPKGGSEMKGVLKAENLFYQKREVGQVEASGNMVEGTSGSHLSGEVALGGQSVLWAEAFAPKSSSKEAKEPLRYHLTVKELPLERSNPFLPAKYAKLKGLMSGSVSNYALGENIERTKVVPLSGQITFEEASLYTPFANETYHLDSKPIRVVDGRILLEEYALSANTGRLTTQGYVSVANGLKSDLRIVGRDMMLLDSDATSETLLYGKVNTDADLRIKGPLSAFKLSGSLSIKGDTDVTYQSQTGELQSRAGYKGLVTFTDFSDTLFVKQKSTVDSLSLGGMDIKLALHIDPAAKVNAILTTDGNNKVALQGGGDFNLSIPPYGAMTLNGAYNIHEGDIHLYVSPLKRKFKVQQGSKVTWNGLLMEPDIDVKATARIRSNVSLAGEPDRQVDFDVHVIAEDRLDNLKLRFEMEAPQDLTIRNMLARLSPEEQNRQSIMLLASGHYFGGGGSSNTKGFNVNGALTSFLASQINSLAGEALDAEINLGITDGTNAYGVGTNYSYSITKRLFNNRISVQVGGKMVTGAAATGLQQTFIDNMSLDYQLDQAGTHYLRLFHNKNYENLLDGEVIETGIGYVIRRKMNKLNELFKFSNPLKSNAPTPRAIWEIKALPRREEVTTNDKEDEENI